LLCQGRVPDRLSLDAAELVASRVGEIDGAAIALIRRCMDGGRPERETVRGALDEAARARR